MLECSCDWDSGDFDGVFQRFRNRGTAREYRKCSECGDVIWPWTEHLVGLWWDCDACDERHDDCWCDDGCDLDRPPDRIYYACPTCENAMESLLCGTWWLGSIWEHIAEQNEMTVKECIGGAV
jgi:hypothetical protein